MPVLRAVLVVVAILAAVAPLPASVVERWYSRGFYARLQPVATSVSSVVPFALLDLAVAVLLVGAGIALATRARRDGWRRALRTTAWSAVVLAAVVYLWFLLFWGLNYRRVPLEQKLAYEPGRVSREQALALARLAVDQEVVASCRGDGLDRETHAAQPRGHSALREVVFRYAVHAP